MKAPTQTDQAGTMFRIRPQTPKLNLLGKKPSQQKASRHVKLASID